MKEERWLPVVGYEGLYEVSSLGRVKSLNYGRTGKEEILEPENTVKGYLRVKLYKNGKGKHKRVHRLVAIAFVPNPEGKPEVDHINGKKHDCRACNLQWVTRKEHRDKDRSKKVLCVETGIVYPSSHEAERKTGANQGHIIKCCRGKYKTTCGYHWQYYVK